MNQPIADDPRRHSLAQVETWVFDLDNTLYPASCSIFPQIDVRMRQFIADSLHLELDAAFALQKRYYRDYGTTLRGLMSVHGIDPAEFLAYVHDIDHSVLNQAPDLNPGLAGLPGRKLIFTNGSERHAVNVLHHLGIADHFDGIFDIVAAGYVPKPQPECYRDFLHRFDLDPRSCAMVEDIHRNLRPAAQAGMTTIWIRHQNHPDDKILCQDDGDLSHIHHITDDLVTWLNCAPTLTGGRNTLCSQKTI